MQGHFHVAGNAIAFTTAAGTSVGDSVIPPYCVINYQTARADRKRCTARVSGPGSIGDHWLVDH